ncbi:MAG: tRNA (adenosine(37)-N6)-threonylcarbamoyltransferase complex ATPase subunit type 1 TsaE [Bacteroidetes bacterium]|nr:tRNA (adenosine(37)-N6)-threonylcarbamoyltransferase complex ATPase subunit type 1 TsaE [Bacteroidota bacterium]
MTTEFRIPENGELKSVAGYLQKLSQDKPIQLFVGDLGAGKTTLIKNIGGLSGLSTQMNSPSFGLVNEYHNADQKFYHMDLYRLNSAEEAFDAGLMEILDSGNVCWVEWPEVLGEVWQSYDVVTIRIIADKAGERRIFVEE